MAQLTALTAALVAPTLTAPDVAPSLVPSADKIAATLPVPIVEALKEARPMSPIQSSLTDFYDAKPFSVEKTITKSKGTPRPRKLSNKMLCFHRYFPFTVLLCNSCLRLARGENHACLNKIEVKICDSCSQLNYSLRSSYA